jgi:hypothetical protein
MIGRRTLPGDAYVHVSIFNQVVVVDKLKNE